MRLARPLDRIFDRPTRRAILDRLLDRLHRQTAALLRVLKRPEIPLTTNSSENDIRASVNRCRNSRATMSQASHTAHDVMLDLTKICAKLGVSFFRCLGNCSGISDGATVPPMPDLIRNASAGWPHGHLLRVRSQAQNLMHSSAFERSANLNSERGNALGWVLHNTYLDKNLICA
ncbi:IS66 family transposase [Methylobacterium sp.]|uniref:IS66 family transposase n=1 Tax=Methylobacterium sp. TaxID=409 RepID=UPI003AFFEDB1